MSQTPSKPGQKMCKSPKNSTNFHSIKQHHDKIDYEALSTNCTVVGSNNLNLVKKPQIVTSMSPAYSNSSPVYPASPYSSPASMKSPSPSLKPPTPQPQTTFPVMQIIHNNHPLLARPIQQQQQNIIKLKPHLNILPKPSSGSPQPSPKASVSPQIMIPTNTQQHATLMQSAQPLLLNQMPMLATTPGVQFILKPQTTTKVQATSAPQGLILQQGGQSIIQLQPPRSQPMVRVLTNSVQLAAPSTTPTTTYVQMGNIPINHTSPSLTSPIPQQQQQQLQKSKKPKAKVKKKLDLANIMKLSGIGDEDDIQFESDASQSENEHNPGSTTPQPQSNAIQMQTSSAIQTQNILHHQSDGKKISGIQIQGIAQPTINATTPVVQVLNQNFQSGMISNSTTQSSGQAGIPFSPFLTPNFTINNGLMVQRSGGFKLAVGEDGRLVLQHDPTLNQDLQSQLILQSIFGLNGGLVLQPSIDQQTVQQTVQTIQQQSVQTIQQQTVQSQTIQTVQQQTVQPPIQATLQPQIQQQTVQQTIQHQTVQSQPITAIQQPMQIVQPQPIHSAAHSLQSQIQNLIQQQAQAQQQQQQAQQAAAAAAAAAAQQQQQQQQQQQHNHPPHSVQATVQPIQHQPIQSLSSISTVQHNHQTHTQPVLKVQPFQKTQLPPVQTVHPQPVQPIQPVQPQLPIQTIHSTNQNVDGGTNQQQPMSYVVNLTPDQLEQLKRNGQLTVNGQTIYMPRSNQIKQQQNENFNEKKLSPKIKPVKKVHKIQAVKNLNENIEALKPIITINHHASSKDIKVQHLQNSQNQQKIVQQKPMQPSAMVQPQPMVERPKVNQQKVLPTTQNNENSDSNANSHDVDKLLGQLLEESNNINIITTSSNNLTTTVPPTVTNHQRIHTIQLTPQKQQHLKNIQVQIQSLSSQLSSGNGNADIQQALKNLFAEQQKILATGKLLPPDKVYYHNNQLTIVNPSSLNSPPPSGAAQQQQQPQAAKSETTSQIQQQQHQHSNNNVRRSVAKTPPTFQATTAQALPSPRIPTSISLTESVQQVQQQPIILPQIIHNSQPQIVVSQQQQQQPQIVGIVGAQNAVTNSTQPTVITSKITASAGANVAMPPPAQLSPQQQFNLLAKKAHLIEAQLTQDQQGASKPDVHTPFRDKRDACIRLIRYHCMDQPVLSQKDLNKADEIFELTARHFIAKYDKMVDKYKYLLLKESQRQVQTSELMMLDRLFLSDEQQSLLRLRQEAEEAQYLSSNPNQVQTSQQQNQQPQNSGGRHVNSANFRQQQQYLNNNSSQQQHVVHNQFHHSRNQYVFQQHEQNETESSSSHHQNLTNEEYDEWACIQRELGCLNENELSHYQQQRLNYLEQHPNSAQQQQQNNAHLQPPKRSASSDSRLETLKRFRVEKHNKKTTTTQITTTSFVDGSSVHNNSVVQSVSNINNSHHVMSSCMMSTTTTTTTTNCCSYDSQDNAYNDSLENEDGIEGKSIDEQVQSAIDSILNLQQSTALDLDSILS